ncbi:MAG: hypothetical protein KDA37_12370, partial [Planctomycetales bacterium]|nr:hypothetical protein [Planctomycetales bacterium]
MKVILRSHYVTSVLRGSVSYLRSLTQKRQVVVSSLLVLSLLSVADSASAVETRKFTVTEATRQGLMGFSAALGGDLGFAGAPAGTTLPGKGYIFNVETGELWHTVRPPTEYNFSDNLFGFNAKMTSNRLIVGDPANPNAVTKRPGAAYVFDPLSGEQLFRLTPSDSFGGNEFGFGINAYQDVAIVGAPNLGVGLGAAYLFDLNTGTQTHKLVAADPLLGSEFGADVAVGADYALVGAPSNYATLGFFPGAAYVFDAATGSQLWKLQPDDSYGGDEFGFDVAIDGHIAVIGAP